MERLWTILDDWRNAPSGGSDANVTRDLDVLDRLVAVLDDIRPPQYVPCGEGCDGKTGDDIDPDYYCAEGMPWTEHRDAEPAKA